MVPCGCRKLQSASTGGHLFICHVCTPSCDQQKGPFCDLVQVCKALPEQRFAFGPLPSNLPPNDKPAGAQQISIANGVSLPCTASCADWMYNAKSKFVIMLQVLIRVHLHEPTAKLNQLRCERQSMGDIQRSYRLGNNVIAIRAGRS